MINTEGADGIFASVGIKLCSKRDHIFSYYLPMLVFLRYSMGSCTRAVSFLSAHKKGC